jgi:glycerol kinase
VRPAIAEASALGVARLAREALGIAAAPAVVTAADRFTPALPSEARDEVVARWRAAIAGAIGAAAGGR